MAANFAFVDDVEFTNNGSSSSFTMAAQNVVAGNLLVVGVRWEGSSSSDTATCSLADTAGNTFQLLGHLSPGGGTETERIALFYVLSALGDASNVITGTLSASRSFRQVLAAQYSYDGTIQLGDTGSGLSTSNTPTVTSSPALDAVTGDLVVGWLGRYNSNTTFTPDSGYTSRSPAGLSFLLEQIVTSGGTFTPSATMSGAGDTYVLLTAVFEGTAGGGTPHPPRNLASLTAVRRAAFH